MTTPLSVLIVEDTPDDAELMLLHLAEEGIVPTWQRVETEAVYLAALETPPDLILAGWSLPQFSGLRALQLMRERDLDIPFVIVSGSVGEEAAIDALRQGAYDYVIKDRPARLGQAVRRALEDKQLRKERRQAEEGLKESEERYRAFINATSDMVFVKDDQGRHLVANKALATFFGKAQADIIGKTDFELMPNEAAVDCHATDLRALEAQGVLISEQQIGDRIFESTKHPVPLRGNKTGVGGIIRDITERRRAEEALRESEDRYRLISEMISDYAYSFRIEADQTLTREWIVGGFERTTGFTPAEAEVRGGWAELIHPDDRHVVEKRSRRLLAGKSDVSEFRIVRKDGQVRWLRDHGHPVYDSAQGRVIRIEGAAEDITERKQAEEALRELKELNESIVQNMAEGVSMSDAQWRVTFANPALAKLLGYTPDELIGQEWSSLIPPDQWAITVAARERRLAGQSDRYEQDLLHKDGKRLSILVSGSPLYDPATGSFAGGLSVITDITERKRAEEALRELKEFNESIVQTVSEGIAMTDEQGTVTFVNPALEKLLGYAPDELVGQNWSLVVAPDQWPITLATRERRRAGQSDRYEQDLLDKDGTRLSVLIGGSPRFDATTGSFAGTLSVITDFTERKQAEEALQQRAWQLALLNEIGSQVAALLDLDQVLDRAAQLVQERFGFHYVTIFVRTTVEDRLEMRAQAGEFVDIFGCGLSVALGQGMIGWVGLHGETLVANDVDAEPRYFNPIPDRLPIRSELCVPIRIGDEILGVLDLQSRQIGAFDSSDVTTLETLASQIATAINNARLYDQVAQRNRELTLLNQVIAATIAAAGEGMEPVLDVVCREMALAFEVPQASAALLNKEKTEALVVAEYVALGVRPWLGERIPLEGVSLSPDLLSHNAPLVIDDAQTDPLLASIHDLMHRREVGSLLLSPLVVDGDLVGSLVVDAAGARRFTAKEVDLAQRVTEQVSGALARARMAESQQRLSIAIEQSAESVIITDTQGSILYVNPAFARVSGYSRKEVLDQNPRILKSGQQDAAFYRDLWQTISAGQIWHGQMVNRGKDGSLYTLDAILTPVHSPTGEISNYVATMRDVTRELQLEEQFLQAQKMEAVGRLAGGVAHDFNNLLTVIHLSTRMLERKLLPEDPLTSHVLRIQEAGQRGANLTRQLLAFSRREIIEPQVLDLNQVLKNLDKMLRRLMGEDVEMALLPADSLWAVQIDPTQVEQVVVNLAVNARDAMPSGGTLIMETANVILDQAYTDRYLEVEPGEYVLLTVSDNGEGMSEEIQAHIFEPFFTTKEKGKGTGLGLATVFGIVKQSGGHIGVYSEVGLGTTFRIYLPRVLADAGAASTLSATHAAPAARGSETLLLVEDESELRDLVRDILSAEGYRVLTAQDGVEALQIAGEHEGPIHILVTDVVMPRMSGKELADRLGSIRPEMQVLFTSGYTDSAIAHHGVLAEGGHFLSKPFEMEGLIRKVRGVLGGKR